MSNRTDVFVDGLVSASLQDGVVRLEFGEYELQEPGDEDQRRPPTLTPRHRLLIPLPGFVRSMGVLQEVLKRIEAQRKDSGRPFVAEADPVKPPT